MRQPASYHGGLGLSLLGQRVRPAPPPRRGGPLLHEPIIFISPTTSPSTSSLPPPPINRHHINCFNPPDNKTSRTALQLKVNTIGEDIDNFLAVGKQLMRIREADTVQQLQRLLHGANLCVGKGTGSVVKAKPKAKQDHDDILDGVVDFYENYFLVHHTTLRNAIAKLADSDAVT